MASERFTVGQRVEFIDSDHEFFGRHGEIIDVETLKVDARYIGPVARREYYVILTDGGAEAVGVSADEITAERSPRPTVEPDVEDPVTGYFWTANGLRKTLAEYRSVIDKKKAAHARARSADSKRVKAAVLDKLQQEQKRLTKLLADLEQRK